MSHVQLGTLLVWTKTGLLQTIGFQVVNDAYVFISR